MSGGFGLLEPGSHRAEGELDDAALLGAIVQVEEAWLRALAAADVLDTAQVESAATALSSIGWDRNALLADTEASGNPVVPVVAQLRAHLRDSPIAPWLHRGLTSQDVLDTALILLARTALDRTRGNLSHVAQSLADLANTHRGTLMAGRTLTQHAVPVTFGLKAAQWLSGVLEALDRLENTSAKLPVQCGGAAGTLALLGEITTEPTAVARALATQLNLRWPGLPWHTNRSPMTGIGDTVVRTTDALGVIASNITLLSRPEIAEVREGAVTGRGGSSTMPHKRNPVLAVLVHSAALQAPLLAAQLHTAAAQAIDERPDGAWHSEWPAFRRLLHLTLVASSQTVELVQGLTIDSDAMQRRVAESAADLLAESLSATRPDSYLGAAEEFIDVTLSRYIARRGLDE